MGVGVDGRVGGFLGGDTLTLDWAGHGTEGQGAKHHQVPVTLLFVGGGAPTSQFSLSNKDSLTLTEKLHPISLLPSLFSSPGCQP